MKIKSVTMYKLNMPLRQPWTTAYGSDDVIRTVIVKMITDDGKVGWGESSPLADPTYSPEYCDGVYAFGAKYIAPNLPGMTFHSPLEQSLLLYGSVSKLNIVVGAGRNNHQQNT